MRRKRLFSCQTLPYPPEGPTVLEDGALRRRLDRSGRATAERHYSWDVIAEELIKTDLNVADRAWSGNPQPALTAAGAACGNS